MQPVIQTLQMFIGEMGCWLVVGAMALYRRFFPSSASTYQPIRNTADADDDDTTNNNNNPRADADNASIRSTTPLSATPPPCTNKDHDHPSVLRGWRVCLLALPAICDILGTTLMNAGLLLVAASIYQMTRGALVLFVGLFSVVFLRRHLHLFQWLSLVGVVLGVGIVGLAGAIQPDKKVGHGGGGGDHHGVEGEGAAAAAAAIGADAISVIIGVLMIAGAQVFTATQFVLEEWILERSAIEPIRVVGWEGVFGFSVTLLGMVVLHLAVGATEAGRYGPFDMVEGWRQFWEHRAVFVSSILIMISIG